MVSPALQCLAGGALVVLGMLVAYGLARLAANLFIALIALGAVFGAVLAILNGAWVGWFEILWRSFGLGLLAALVSLPALPFSSFLRPRRK